MKGYFQLQTWLTLALSFLLFQSSFAITYTWTGNNSSDWSDMGNWTPSGIPANGDDIILNSGTVNLGSGNAINLAGMTLNGGTLQVSNGAALELGGTAILGSGATLVNSGTLTLATNLNVEGTLDNDVGSIAGSSNLTITGTLKWGSTSAIIGVSGQFVNDGVIDINGGGNLATILRNNGTINQSGNLLLAIAAEIINIGTLDFQNDSDISAGSSNNNGIDNQGTVKKSGGTVASSISVVLNNKGNVVCEQGKLAFLSDGQHSGNFSSVAPGNISFASGIHVMDGGNSLSGSGWNSVDGAEILILGNVSATNMRITQGKIRGDFDFRVSGEMEWLGGKLGDESNPDGIVSIAGTLLIDGGDVLECQLDNFGSVTWVNSDFQMGSRSEIFNQGSFGIQGDLDILFQGLPEDFNNFGTLKKSTGAGVSQIFVFVDNSGSIQAQSGEIRFKDGGVNSGDILIDDGATVEASSGDFLNRPAGGIEGKGAFTASANVTNRGFFRPGSSPGTLTLKRNPGGNILVEDSTTFFMEIGGLQQGTEYDHLILDGTIAIGGVLEIQVIDSFIPAIGDSFVLISYSNIGGSTFKEIREETGDPSTLFEVEDNGNEIVVRVVADTTFVGLTEIETDAHFDLYPNPTSGNLYISFGQAIGVGELLMKNIDGKLLKRMAFESKKELCIEYEGQSGIFFIEVRTDKWRETRSVLVVR